MISAKCNECGGYNTEIVLNDGGGFAELLRVCDDCGEVEVV
jgi:uncharacterized Zn finger protein